MPNVEFIARNGIVSRGNLVVSGSVISTSPASFSGALSVTGSFSVLGSGDITQANGDGYLKIGNNGGGTIIENYNRTDLSLKANAILTTRGTGVTFRSTKGEPNGAILGVIGSGTTSSTTSLLVQNSAGTAVLTVKDDLSSTFGGVITGAGGITLGATTSNTPVVSISGYFVGTGAITTSNFNGRSFNTIIGGQGSGIISQYNGVAQGVGTNNEYFLAGGNINLTDGAIDLRGFSFAPTIVSETGATIKAFWSGLSAASNRYNLFLSGSAQNYIAGNVGIGTSTPSASLHISGSSNSVLFEIDSPAVNNIIFVSGSGRVGIGTGTPARTLEVFKSGLVDGSIDGVRITVNHGSATAQAALEFYHQAGPNPNSRIATDVGSGGLSPSMYFFHNGSNRITITSGGNVLIGTSTNSARLTVQGSGATSSTTALLVQNANASASLSVKDDGTTAVLSSNENPFTVSHTNGSSKLGIVVGNGSALSAGFAALRLNDSVNVFTFGGNRTVTGYPLTVGNPAETFFIRGGGGGTSVANPSVALTDNTYNAGGYTVTSGTQTTVQIGGIGTLSNAIWKPASGSANYHLLAVAPNMSGSGTYSGIIRGIFYAPTVDSTTYGAHRAIETTAGDVVFNGGRVSISGSAGSGSALYAYKSGSTVLDIQGSQGQLFSVIDALSGSLMSVNDISGLPIVEVFSDDRVVMGTYGAPGLTVSGSTAAVATGSSAPTGTAPEGTFRFAIAGGLYYIYAYIGGAWRSGSLA